MPLPVEELRPISDDQLSEQNRIFARPTAERAQASTLGFYIVKMHPRLKKRLRIGSWATVIYKHPIVKYQKWNDFHDGRPEDISGFLTAHCRVVKLQRHERKASEAIAPTRMDAERYVMVDQTVRNALGIPVMIGISATPIELYIYPARKSGRLRDRVASLLGRRYLYFRAAVSSVSDMEKGVARIPQYCFPMLGTDQGAGVIAERSVRAPLNREGKITHFHIISQRIKAFVASEEFLDQRRRLEGEFPDRYFPASRLLYSADVHAEAYPAAPRLAEALEPDIPPIFADSEFRANGVGHDRPDLVMTPLTAVAVRRDITDVFVRELQNFGIVLVVSLYPLLESLAKAAGAAGPYGSWNWPFLIGWTAIPLGLLVLLAWRVRKQVV